MFNRSYDYEITDQAGNIWNIWLERERELDDSVTKNYWKLTKNGTEVRETLPTYRIPSKQEFENYVNNYETAINDRLWWYK